MKPTAKRKPAARAAGKPKAEVSGSPAVTARPKSKDGPFPWRERLRPPLMLAAGALALASGILWLSWTPVGSAFILAEVNTGSVAFTVRRNEPLPVLQARKITVTAVCDAEGRVWRAASVEDDQLPKRAASANGAPLPSIRRVKLRSAERVALSMADGRLTIALPVASGAASDDCAGAGPVQLDGAFRLSGRDADSGVTVRNALVRIAPGAEIRLEESVTLGEWTDIGVRDGMNFEEQRDRSVESLTPVLIDVSMLRRGEYIFPGFRGSAEQPTKLFRGQQIQLNLSTGTIHSLDLEDDGLVLSISGTADQFDTRAGDRMRPLLPSLLEWVRQGPLAAIVASILALVALLANVRSAFIKEKDN